MQFTSSGVPACSFCLNRYRSQLGSTNIRAEGLSSDPVLCEYFGQMVETLLTGPTLALIVSPNGSLVYTALHILLKTGIHNFCPDVCPNLQSVGVGTSCLNIGQILGSRWTDFTENHIVYDGHK